MKKAVLALSLMSLSTSMARADEAELLERFRDHNFCSRVTCHENQTESFARKERARGGAISACNAGPGDITLKIRRKKVRRWETVREQLVKPNNCYSLGHGTNHLVQRQYELKVNSSEGTTYHLNYRYREVYRDVAFSLFTQGPY